MTLAEGISLKQSDKASNSFVEEISIEIPERIHKEISEGPPKENSGGFRKKS